MAKVKEFGLAKRAATKRAASGLGFVVAALGGLGVVASIASGSILTVAPSLGLMVASASAARTLGRDARRLESQAGAVSRVLARRRGEAKGGLSGARAALARGAAARTGAEMKRPSTIGVRSALARGAKERPSGDGSVKAHTRVVNGKAVQIGAHQRGW